MKMDFRHCKTPEDVEKVFAQHKQEFDAIRKEIKEAMKPSTEDKEDREA